MAIQRRMQILDSELDNTAGLHPELCGLKVAFTTTDMKTVNQHFGSAKSLAIYAINPDSALLVEVLEFGQQHDGEEDKLSDKLDVLKGCAAVYSQAIGSSAIQKLLQIGVQPIKMSEGAEISDLINAVQEEMQEGPSKWLAKAIAKQKGPDMHRFDEMETEGWDE